MNSKTNTVRAILLDASECDRPEADHPATIEICADDLQRILERHITEPAQCLLQIAEPAAPHAARDLGLAALEQYLKECEENQIVADVGGAFAYAWQRAAAPQAVQATEEMRVCNSDECGWIGPLSETYGYKNSPATLCPECKETTELSAPAHPAEGVPAQAAQFVAGITANIDKLNGLHQERPWNLKQAEVLSEAIAALAAIRELAATQPAAQGMTEAARSVLAERARQIAAEGWTPEKDDAYNPGVLAEAGGIYALHAFDPRRVKETPEGWPWSPGWWKPKDPRTNLVKAGALVLAEIERIDRTYAAQAKQGGAA